MKTAVLDTLGVVTLFFHLTLNSSNRKTGKMPVSVTSAHSCPLHCPLRKNGCYEEGGPGAINWRKVTNGERGTTLDPFCDKIRALPDGQIWRHNEGGDLPSKDCDRVNLDPVAVGKIVDANKGKKGFTYTHFDPLDGDNAAIIRDANQQGFTVNLSADNLAEADRFKALNVGPVVVVLPKSQKTNLKTPDGNLVVICPFETKGVQCKDCKLCAWSGRECIIGFPAHGSQYKKAELVAIQGMAVA